MASLGLRPRNPSPYYSQEGSRAKSLQDYLAASGEAMSHDYQPAVKPEFNYLQQAMEADQKASELAAQSAMNAAHNATPIFTNNPPPGYSPGMNGSPRLQAILRALAGQESGGNYGAVNSSSGALGAFQVMPSNLQGPGGWDQEALGRNISTQQFLQNKALQNAIVRYKFGNYLQNYGLKGALSAWYSGDPNAWNSRDPQGNYPSIHDYVLQVLHRLGIG